MALFICRWPNGDVSVAAGDSEFEVNDVLDEVDNPDVAELMQLDHAIAVHFNLGTKPGEGGALPLRFEEMSEQLESSIYERAYPVYNEVRMKPHPTVKELTEALIQEKNPIYRKAPEPSSNPAVADLQDELQMPRIVLEHLAGRAEAAAVVPEDMSTQEIRDMVAIPFTAWTGLLPGSLNHPDHWFPSNNGLKLGPS
jgi:hypothetical protein